MEVNYFTVTLQNQSSMLKSYVFIQITICSFKGLMNLSILQINYKKTSSDLKVNVYSNNIDKLGNRVGNWSVSHYVHSFLKWLNSAKLVLLERMLLNETSIPIDNPI